jgi:lipoate-protein ligase A
VPLLRVVVHPGAAGPWNMAVDDALLRDPQGGWTLRFYSWETPTISVGYAQPLQRAVDEQLARRRHIPLVRRPTGGRAVLHADELTYAIVAPADRGVLAGDISASYRRIAAGLHAGLRRLGAAVEVERTGVTPPSAHRGACFSARTRSELSVDGRKLVGSAQRRLGGRLLQHGSLLLGPPQPRLWAALGEGADEALRASVGLEEVLGWRPGARALIASLTAGIAAELGLTPRRTRLSRHQRLRAAALYRHYRSAEWTQRA